MFDKKNSSVTRYRFNTFDQSIINADIDTVYTEMMREFSGNRQWWKHLWESKSNNDIPIYEPGGSLDITVHSYIDAHFSARTVAIIEKKQLDIVFYAGDFTGHATWRWDIESENTTRVSQSWHVSPCTFKLRLAALLLNIPAIHSKVINGGFDALNAWLESRQKMH